MKAIAQAGGERHPDLARHLVSEFVDCCSSSSSSSSSCREENEDGESPSLRMLSIIVTNYGRLSKQLTPTNDDGVLTKLLPMLNRSGRTATATPTSGRDVSNIVFGCGLILSKIVQPGGGEHAKVLKTIITQFSKLATALELKPSEASMIMVTIAKHDVRSAVPDVYPILRMKIFKEMEFGEVGGEVSSQTIANLLFSCEEMDDGVEQSQEIIDKYYRLIVG